MNSVLVGSSLEPSAEPAAARVSWSRWALIAAEAVVLMLAALIVRLCYQNPTAFVDEYYHLVAARTLVESGWQSLVMNPGGDPYDRAWLFTYMVAAAYELFGMSIASGRLPSVVLGVLLVGVMFGWLRGRGYRAEAWATALLVTASLEMVNYSQTARFYMLQTLAVVLLAIAAWALVRPGRRWGERVVAAVSAILFAALAMHTQVTSLFAIAAVGGWGVLIVSHQAWWHSPAEHRRRNRRWVLVGLGVCALGGVAVLLSGVLDAHWERYRLTFGWAQEQRDNVWFYWDSMSSRYKWMWWLLPAGAAVALLRDWRIASLALCVFVFGFVGQSFGGMKAERYMVFVLPFFLLVWGLAMGAFGSVVLRVGALVTEAVYERVGLVRWSRPLSTATAALTVMLFLGYALYRTPSFFIAYQLVTGQRTHFGLYQHPDWTAATPALLKQLQGDEVILSGTSPATLFHLDRIDYGLNLSEVDEIGQGEFGRDWRTDRPVISTVDSLERVMREQPSGLIVIDHSRSWRKPGLVPDAVADYIEQHTQRVELPAEADILAFRWDHATRTADDDRRPAETHAPSPENGGGS